MARSVIPMKITSYLFLSVVATSGIALADPSPPPVHVTISTKPAQMKYDVSEFEATPGAKVTLTLKNEDDLPHNLVICKAKQGADDKGLDVAMQAWNMGEAGIRQDWIPENDRIIAHTKMVNPHQSETIEFTAPDIEGRMPFVCTFPGHALIMNGVFFVRHPVPPIKGLHYRYYVAKPGQHLQHLPSPDSVQSVEEEELPAGKVDISIHEKDRKNDFAYEFEGRLDCPKDGAYRFAMGSDDGSALWIDDKEIIKDDNIHPFGLKNKQIKLTKGEHRIKAEYFQAGGEAQFYLNWSGPGFSEMPLSVWEPAADERKSEKERFNGIPLVVDKEARVYRNFIEGCSPRAIAVGYPGGVNICWDADEMNTALVWQGAFMDAKRHWTDRGVGNQPPLGYGVAKLGLQRALGVLDSQTAPWVPSYVKNQPRDTAYTFHGFELDAQRFPTFHWEFNGVKVDENFTPSGDAKKENAAVERHLKLTATRPIDNLYFLALKGAIEPKDKAFIYDHVVSVTMTGEPIVRKDGGATELLLPITFHDGKAEVTMHYSWNLK